MSRLLLLGGSDAGISAALRARELDATWQVTVVVEDTFPNYSICGLPFFLSGEVQDYQQLAHRTHSELSEAGISLLLNHQARIIEPGAHEVVVQDETGHAQCLPYDRLLIATGARSRRLRIPGLDLPGVFLLHSMADSFALQQYLSARSPRSAVVVGGGYIGLEMADALTLRGIAVTLVEHGPSVLKTIDPHLGALVRANLEQHGVVVETGIGVQHIAAKPEQLCVSGTGGFEAMTDLVLAAAGVEPRTELMQAIGAELGIQGAIQASRSMETTLPDILAADDCVETWHRLLTRPTYLPLGTTAHKQE